MGKFGVTGKMELKEVNSKEKEKKTTFVDLWCNFKESCTLHGIGHVSLTHCFRGYVKKLSLISLVSVLMYDGLFLTEFINKKNFFCTGYYYIFDFDFLFFKWLLLLDKSMIVIIFNFRDLICNLHISG